MSRRTALRRRSTTKTVTAERVIISERDPSAPDDRCFAGAYYEFADVPGTTSATLTFKQGGADQSITSAPPYWDELMIYGMTIPPAAGHHRIATDVYGSAAGPGAGGHCDENVVPAIEAGTSPTGTVELTGEFKDDCRSTRSGEPACDSDQKFCNEAFTDLTILKNKVGKLKRLIAEENHKETKKRLTKKLKAQKKKLQHLKDVIEELC